MSPTLSLVSASGSRSTNRYSRSLVIGHAGDEQVNTPWTPDRQCWVAERARRFPDTFRDVVSSGPLPSSTFLGIIVR
jgi:hypothetical protein